MNLDYNVGSTDRNVRIGVGVLFLIIGLFFAESWLIVVVGAILIATGIFSFCPAYKLLGMNTASDSDEAKFLDDTPAERASENIEEVKQEVTETAKEAKEKASGMAEEAKVKASELAEEAKEEARETFSEAKEEASELMDEAKEKLADAKDAVKKKKDKS